MRQRAAEVNRRIDDDTSSPAPSSSMRAAARATHPPSCGQARGDDQAACAERHTSRSSASKSASASSRVGTPTTCASERCVSPRASSSRSSTRAASAASSTRRRELASRRASKNSPMRAPPLGSAKPESEAAPVVSGLVATRARCERHVAMRSSARTGRAVSRERARSIDASKNQSLSSSASSRI
jgi:hypothetical protein